MTSASPTASRRHWSLFRATWPRSAPCSPASGSKTKGSIVARRPSGVAVTRSAAPWWVSRSRTAASSMAKCAGTYMAPVSPLYLALIMQTGPIMTSHDRTGLHDQRTGLRGSADEAGEQAVQVGVRIAGEPAVHRTGLDDGAPGGRHPAEASPSRPSGGPPRGLPPCAHRLDAGERGADGVHVGLPVEGEQPDLVDVHGRPQVVAGLAVDHDAAVDALAAIDPRHRLEQRVLERHVPRGRPLGLADVAHRPTARSALTVNHGRFPAARRASMST